MYPLDAVLLGCQADVLPTLRRELVKQHVNAQDEFASVGALIASEGAESEWTGGESEPVKKARLFVLYLKGSRDLPEVRRLAATYASSPVLAILEANSDQALLISAMREGAAQVVLLPLQADDFKTALDRIGAQFGHAATDCLAIAVTGVTGGSGATSIALNLACEVAHHYDARCLLVELSLQMGVLATYLNIEPTYTTQDLLKHKDRLGAYDIQKALTRLNDRMHVLTGPYRSIGSQTASPRELLRIIEGARKFADVLVLDVPSTYDDLFFHSLAAGDEVVLVGEQRVPSVRAMSLLARTLNKEAGIAAPHLVINRYDPHLTGFLVPDLEKLLDVAHIHTVAKDTTATIAADQGKPWRVVSQRSKALADIDKLVDAVTRFGGGSTAKSASFFGKLVNAFGLK